MDDYSTFLVSILFKAITLVLGMVMGMFFTLEITGLTTKDIAPVLEAIQDTIPYYWLLGLVICLILLFYGIEIIFLWLLGKLHSCLEKHL